MAEVATSIFVVVEMINCELATVFDFGGGTCH